MRKEREDEYRDLIRSSPWGTMDSWVIASRLWPEKFRSKPHARPALITNAQRFLDARPHIFGRIAPKDRWAHAIYFVQAA